MAFLQLLAEALLYYLACRILVHRQEEAPGLIRIFVTVFLLAVVSGGLKYAIGDFWLTSIIIFVINFFILLIGLGIGFFRTVLAAILVIVLRMILTAAFNFGRGPELFG